MGVVIIELFAGICIGSLAIANLGLPILAHYVSEIDPDSLLLISTLYPSACLLGDICAITRQNCKSIVDQFPGQVLFLLLAGPPCQDVSLLSIDRSGANGPRSGLRKEFARVYGIFRSLVPDSRIRGLMECVRMDAEDLPYYNGVFGSSPHLLCAKHWLPITRPRLWWFSHTPVFPRGTKLVKEADGIIVITPVTNKTALEDILFSGWQPIAVKNGQATSTFHFRCLTRHRPRKSPMKRPRGLARCNKAALARWRADSWSQAPYQYMDSNLVQNAAGDVRRLCSTEEERLQGVPDSYTASLLQLGVEPVELERRRKSLLGNSWNLPVATFCLAALLQISVVRTTQDACQALPYDHSIGLDSGAFPFVSATLSDSCWKEYTRIRMDLSRAFDCARQACPFITECFGSGIPETGIGPAYEELWASQCLSNALHIAARHTGFAVSRQKLLPQGLPAELHCQLGRSLPHPLDNLPTLPLDLDFAIRMSLRKDYDAWSRRQRRCLAALFEQIKPLQEFYRRNRTSNAMLTSGHVSPRSSRLA